MTFNIPTPPIGQVFRDSYPFYVPKYQRGYAWEAEEISDFITDIQAVQIKGRRPGSHFLGGMVNVYVPAPNIVSRKHEVVDGQQRMATVSLIMACIHKCIKDLGTQSTRKAFKQKCDAHADVIGETFLWYKELSGQARVDLPKLRLSRVDDEFFQSLIATGNAAAKRESHFRLQRAYDEIMQKLVKPAAKGSGSDAAALKSLYELFKTVSEGLVVIHIISQTHGEAYRLFSVLNDRGRSLTEGDLLRAYTLELLEANKVAQGQVESMWDTILDDAAEGVSRLLKAYYPSVTGLRAPNSQLFDAYKAQFLAATGVREVTTFVSGLAKDRPYFLSIQNGDWPFPPSLNATAWDRDRLRRLVKILRHEAAHPLLLSAVGLGEKHFKEVVRLLERFVFRYITIVGAHPSPLYKPYYDEAKKMRASPKTYKIQTLRVALAELVRLRATDDLFRNNLIAKLVYSDNNARNREIRHFLSTLESYSGWYNKKARHQLPEPDSMTVYDLEATTLEHVYPANAASSDKLSDLEEVKNRLANLTIMNSGENSDIGNKAFLKKKATFQKSGITLTRDLASESAWTRTEFNSREARLTAMALAVFGF